MVRVWGLAASLLKADRYALSCNLPALALDRWTCT
jgi:hypothetical protein